MKIVRSIEDFKKKYRKMFIKNLQIEKIYRCDDVMD